MLTEWLTSLKIYSYSVLAVHVIIFTYFFPHIVFYTVFVTITFCLFWCWCSLIHEMEETNRNHILHLIHTCSNEHTKDMLCYELFLHDQNSLAGGDRTFNSHGL
jgi:hypothetical protein